MIILGSYFKSIEELALSKEMLENSLDLVVDIDIVLQLDKINNQTINTNGLQEILMIGEH